MKGTLSQLMRVMNDGMRSRKKLAKVAIVFVMRHVMFKVVYVVHYNRNGFIYITRHYGIGTRPHELSATFVIYIICIYIDYYGYHYLQWFCMQNVMMCFFFLPWIKGEQSARNKQNTDFSDICGGKSQEMADQVYATTKFSFTALSFLCRFSSSEREESEFQI